MGLLKGLTYKQILLVKGISFSLLLLASNHLFKSSNIYLFLYVALFVIRYIFSYNLENHKLKFCPLWEFMLSIPEGGKSTLTDEETLLLYGTDKSTEVYKLKTSDAYEFALCLSSGASAIMIFIYYLNYIFSLLGYIFNLLGYVYNFITSAGFVLFLEVSFGIALIFGLVGLVQIQLNLKRASVKDQLKD